MAEELLAKEKKGIFRPELLILGEKKQQGLNGTVDRLSFPSADGECPHDRLPYWCFTENIPDRLIKMLLGCIENANKSGIKFGFSIMGL